MNLLKFWGRNCFAFATASLFFIVGQCTFGPFFFFFPIKKKDCFSENTLIHAYTPYFILQNTTELLNWIYRSHYKWMHMIGNIWFWETCYLNSSYLLCLAPKRAGAISAHGQISQAQLLTLVLLVLSIKLLMHFLDYLYTTLMLE